MATIDDDDAEFARQFVAGELQPADFHHGAHLRLAYVHLATRGPVHGLGTFRDALQKFLRHHGIDPGKFHETLTQAWLLAVWHFMQRNPNTASSAEFLRHSGVLLDPKVMLTHYSREVLFSEEARCRFVAPDLEAIPNP